MKIFKTVQELTFFRTFTKGSTGFVPTMGALHSGHLSLIRSSKNENDFTGCSIFINPLQFTNPEDFEKYPATLLQDLKFLENEGCDWVFLPSVAEMYPNPVRLKFDFGDLENVMEGAFRPGHFNGVAIVVAKLFHAAFPDKAYFGRKDLQQTLVVKQLTADLGFNIEIRVQETLREDDGLAMSSRNVRLDQFQRQLAPVIYQTISFLKLKILEGEKIEEMFAAAKYNLLTVKGLKLEYLEIADASNLQSVEDSFKGEIAICIACYLGNVRLIDNVVFNKH